MLTQSTIGDSGVGDSSGSVHESPTNQAQFNLIYPNQMLGIQALGIQALGIRAVYQYTNRMHVYVSCWLGMRTWQCSQTPNLQIYTATCNCLPRNQNINQDQVAEPCRLSDLGSPGRCFPKLPSPFANLALSFYATCYIRTRTDATIINVCYPPTRFRFRV